MKICFRSDDKALWCALRFCLSGLNAVMLLILIVVFKGLRNLLTYMSNVHVHTVSHGFS